MGIRLVEAIEHQTETEKDIKPSDTVIIELNGQLLPVKSYGGGHPMDENTELSSGTWKPSAYVGIRDISELTIVAYVTPYQNILSDAADSIANSGFNDLYTIKITTLSKNGGTQKTLIYDQCLLTSLDYPTLDAEGGDILCQTATFQPTILNIT